MDIYIFFKATNNQSKLDTKYFEWFAPDARDKGVNKSIKIFIGLNSSHTEDFF